MPRQYFIDSWYFIASIDRLDSHHRNARRLTGFIDGAPLVSHEGVLTEVLAYFSSTGPAMRTLAMRTVRGALLDCEIIKSSDLFRAGLDLYERRPDKQYSLVDCMSMVVMRDRGIEHVLTNDHHFRQEGFTVLADAP
jgi:predicted nucleic acid-binding protein